MLSEVNVVSAVLSVGWMGVPSGRLGVGWTVVDVIAGCAVRCMVGVGVFRRGGGGKVQESEKYICPLENYMYLT